MEGNHVSLHMDVNHNEVNEQRTKMGAFILCLLIISVFILAYVTTILVVFGDFGDKSSAVKREEASYTSSCCVYCSGEMLSVIQEYDFFNDSKHFIDMPMLKDPDKILHLWNQRIVKKGLTTNKEAVYEFILKYFDDVASDLTDCVPVDFNGDSIPQQLKNNIADDTLQQFALSIHRLWQYLCKHIDADVYINPLRHSLLPLKYPQMIVAGGRFREVYYWDTYWIIHGLLISNMSESAKMTLANLMNLTATYGHMLNGNRVYYQNRSQPPLLTFMMDLIYEFEGKNDSFIKQNMEYLEILKQEYNWWMKGQSINISKHNIQYTLNRYYINSNEPRAEEFTLDTSVVAQLPNKTAASMRHAYSSLRSVAESGWDLSSRFCLHLYCELDLSNIDTTNIIPVELNAYLYHIESTLSSWFEVVDMNQDAEYFSVAAEQRLDAMYDILWNDTDKRWNDYDIRNDQQISEDGFSSLSSYIPLWVLPYNESIGVNALISLNNSGLLYVGGAATTNVYDGQQWDLPNAWPPLQWIIVQIAKKYKHTEIGEYILRNITQSFIDDVFIGYVNTGFMAEKYNVFEPGQFGNGGNSPAQLGFGWSNGVTLSFLYEYGDFLVAPNITFIEHQQHNDNNKRKEEKTESTSSNKISYSISSMVLI